MIGGIPLSIYTDREHEKGLEETLYWLEKEPVTREEKYAYGEYQYSLKDYREAVVWYKKSAEESYTPAMYKLAYCMRHNLGICSDYEVEIELFKQVIVQDEKQKNAEAKYRLGMCHTYGYGTKADERKGASYFQQIEDENADALYEIGLIYKEGKGGYQVDKKKAEQYLERAYDGFCENAIFTLFDMFEGDFEHFLYIREIKEAYSFKIGRLMRVAELKPCSEYLTRLADFYNQGYPGDTGEKLERFRRKAEKYYKAYENK
jgi:TPR repeat protein